MELQTILVGFLILGIVVMSAWTILCLITVIEREKARRKYTKRFWNSYQRADQKTRKILDAYARQKGIRPR
jgi:hypothetical protein